MEINLNYAFKNLDGTEITGPPKEGEKKGEVFFLKTACENALLGMYQDEQKLSGSEKAKRYALAMEIHKSNGKVDLSVDDLKLLKDLIAKNGGPLIVGQAYEILDPPKKERPKIPSKKNT